MDLPIGERLCVQINGRQVVLFNLDGQLRAIANTCPHAGRPLDDGLLHGHKLTCAYHGYSFDLKTGRCLNYQDDPSLRTFPVRIEQGQIQIATPHSTPATPGTL